MQESYPNFFLTSEPINFSGQEGYQVYVGGAADMDGDRSLVTLWNRGGYLWVFTMVTTLIDPNQDTYRSILSTFKFLE